MENDVLKEKVQNIIQLPALPSIALEVASLIDNPKTSVSMLTKVISADHVLTAKVLKIANSPFYGFQKKISTLILLSWS
jgi:Predicted signal transduction protein